MLLNSFLFWAELAPPAYCYCCGDTAWFEPCLLCVVLYSWL